MTKVAPIPAPATPEPDTQSQVNANLFIQEWNRLTFLDLLYMW